MALPIYDKIKQRVLRAYEADSKAADAAMAEVQNHALDAAMMAAIPKTATAAEIEAMRTHALETLNAKDFWQRASLGVAMQGGVSANQLGQASTNRVGPGNIDWGEPRPAARPQELPYHMRSRVWHDTRSDTTRTDLAVHCNGGEITLTFEAPMAISQRPTAREVIEDLQQQLVRQLALIALKED